MRLMTINELSQFLGLKKSTIYRMVYARRIPVVKISHKCIRFEQGQIEEWLRSKTEHPAPNPRKRKTGDKDPVVDILLERVKYEAQK